MAEAQYTNYNPNNVLVGFATLWYAPYPLGGPAAGLPNVPLGTAWPSPWVTPGATETGVTWAVDEKDTDIMIEEQPNPVNVVADTQDYTFDVTLAEDTLNNMLLAYGRGNIAATAGTSRTAADGVVTAGSPTVTSAADANFQQSDVGASISGTGIPAGTTILSVQSATSATMSADATASSTSAAPITLTITGNAFSTLTFSITKNKYSFGLEGTNAHGLARRIYLPEGVVAGTKVDTIYQRAKAPRTYKTSLRAICPPQDIQIVEFTS